MMNLTVDQKRKVDTELGKLSTHGSELLTLFQKQMKDPTTTLHKVIVECFQSNWCSYVIKVAKGWMVAQNASELDICCVGNIIRYTGAWGIWPVG